MESKFARMLRGGLSAHVVNYRLEWEGKPSTEAVKMPSPVTRTACRFGPFDSQGLIFRFSGFRYSQRESGAVQDPAALPLFSLDCLRHPLFGYTSSLNIYRCIMNKFIARVAGEGKICDLRRRNSTTKPATV